MRQRRAPSLASAELGDPLGIGFLNMFSSHGEFRKTWSTSRRVWGMYFPKLKEETRKQKMYHSEVLLERGKFIGHCKRRRGPYLVFHSLTSF